MFKLQTYKKNTDGNLSMMFGGCVMIIMFGVAAAADYSGMVSKKADLRDQVDNATLSAAVKKSDNQGNPDFDLNTAVKEALEANGYDLSLGKPIVKEENGVINVAVNVPHKLTFGKLLGSPTKNINIDSTVEANGGEQYEIALVLDSTDSMSRNGRIGALRIAGYEFIETIRDENAGTRIAIIPFSRYVTVGTGFRNAIWLDVPEEFDTERSWQQATHNCESVTYEPTTETRDGEEYTYDKKICHGRTTTYETKTKIIESRWEGCVGVRTNGLHLVDGSYNLELVPGLLNTIPHETLENRNVDKEAWCPESIMPLTDDYDLLKTKIADIYPVDSTYIPLGLSWAQRVLSPGEPFTEIDTNKQKIVVLMTDGNNTVKIDHENSTNPVDMATPPYLQQLSFGTVATQANADTLVMCNTLKSEGTKIFTIAFQVPDETTKKILNSCASSPANYFDAGSGEQLSRSFAAIAGSLKSELRIVR